MALRLVVRQLGSLLLLLSACMGGIALLLLGADWYAGVTTDQWAFGAMGIAVLVGVIFGGGMWGLGKGGDTFVGRREALLLVALSWLVGAGVAALPYFIWAHFSPEAGAHPFREFSACYFESMSGLTTTGASVLHTQPSDIESLPDALLLWRAMTHWLGGLGIVVLFVAVLPTLGVGGKRLFQVEAPGPQQQGVRPRIRETARILWLIYLALTIVQTGVYWLLGMNLFDSVCHTFATLATGGFSTRNASLGYYDSASIDFVTIFFMILAGLNFGLYYHLCRGRWRLVWRDPEMRLYLSIILGATVLIGVFLFGGSIVTTTGEEKTLGLFGTIRYALFNVVTIQTTTGFGNADFHLWAFLPKALLLVLMFVGGCAGSTGGGIKVIRVLVAFKVIFAEIERVFRPKVVRTIRVGTGVVDNAMRQSVLAYVIIVFGLFTLGAIGLMLLEPEGSISIVTAATASAATLNNIGPGLEEVGPVANYNFFSPASKVLMSILMALGRLEVFALLVLFRARFWRGD